MDGLCLVYWAPDIRSPEAPITGRARPRRPASWSGGGDPFSFFGASRNARVMNLNGLGCDPRWSTRKPIRQQDPDMEQPCCFRQRCSTIPAGLSAAAFTLTKGQTHRVSASKSASGAPESGDAAFAHGCVSKQVVQLRQLPVLECCGLFRQWGVAAVWTQTLAANWTGAVLGVQATDRMYGKGRLCPAPCCVNARELDFPSATKTASMAPATSILERSALLSN